MSFSYLIRNAQGSSSLGSIRLFTFPQIRSATQNFAEYLVMGIGGFGKVYKGKITIEGNDTLVAVKRRGLTSEQGEHEFLAEVKMLSKLSHQNVISLIGYCNEGAEMIIVYEFMANGTLKEALFKGPTTPSWCTRLKIILGVAKGLNYLHDEISSDHKMIHRDVKSSNVLLDKSWKPRISDFGLSVTFQTNQDTTHVTTTDVRGSDGYCDPHYWKTGHVTRKADVYAFGVIVFENLFGIAASDTGLAEDHILLTSWALDRIKKGMLMQIVDSNLKGTTSSRCLKRLADLAVKCVDDEPKCRPTMADVVKEVESILHLQEGKKKKKPGGKLLEFASGSHTQNSDFHPTKLSGSLLSRAAGMISVKPSELYLLNVRGDDQIFRRFDYKTITLASETNRLSKNHFDIYKGKLGTRFDVVVCGPFTKDHGEEIINEAYILANLKHVNLVQLSGYCVKKGNMYLIYDLKPYATLDHLLFADNDRARLNWDSRYKILLGVANVLVYLHNHAPFRVIHFDVNSGCIMLDNSLEPKLFGFYFAQTRALDEPDQIEMSDGFNQCVVPEYAKSDVFNFGVLVLETVTGKKRTELQDDNLLEEYVGRNWKEGKLLDVIDQGVIVDLSSLKIVMMIGLMCTRVDAGQRPTMEEVAGFLRGHLSADLVRSIETLDWEMGVRTKKMVINNDDNISEVDGPTPNLSPR